jgi:hypothetical protein
LPHADGVKADHEQGGEAAAGLQAWKGNGAAHGCQAPRAGTTRTTITFEIPARFFVPTDLTGSFCTKRFDRN